MFALAMGSIIRLKNNTDNVIDKVEFFYNEESQKLHIKRIKSHSNKQTGVPTTSNIRDLTMSINNSEKRYIIKSFIPKNFTDKIIIDINEINGDNCDFILSYEPDIE